VSPLLPVKAGKAAAGDEAKPVAGKAAKPAAA
jgi:hypothetical protein